MKNAQRIVDYTRLAMQSYLSVARPLLLLYALITLAILLHWVFWLPATIMILDVRARFSDFIRFRKIDYNQRMADLLEKSWCKRGVAQAIWPEAKVNYYLKGYRAYHVLPVGAPKVFFQLRFWEAVIGTKHPDKTHKHW